MQNRTCDAVMRRQPLPPAPKPSATASARFGWISAAVIMVFSVLLIQADNSTKPYLHRKFVWSLVQHTTSKKGQAHGDEFALLQLSTHLEPVLPVTSTHFFPKMSSSIEAPLHFQCIPNKPFFLLGVSGGSEAPWLPPKVFPATCTFQ